ncbi:hypothetical protein [Lysobacter arvi]|uniref:Secreted protein n=1 Tax=Lysobacter arvi TaxID=3038776 RepID=A0ABU1C956_9GAMM|nr:hypothetical protein [Lysobacter arvi]MDR0181716.1 hypothetical protein [Lysobacter arvi]
MTDTFPSRRQLIMGVLAIASLAVLGSIAVEALAVDECRSAVSHATTPYKLEKALRSATCEEARGARVSAPWMRD